MSLEEAYNILGKEEFMKCIHITLPELEMLLSQLKFYGERVQATAIYSIIDVRMSNSCW